MFKKLLTKKRLSLACLSLALVSCGGTPTDNTITTDRRFTIFFESGQVQYRSDIDVTLAAQRIIPLGNAKETFDVITPQAQSIVEKAASTLPATPTDEELVELLKRELNEQTLEVAQGSWGWSTVTVTNIETLQNLIKGCEKSFAKWMSRYEGLDIYQGGGCTGTDSDRDGNISAETIRLKPTRNQIPEYYLLCSTNGEGCKGNDKRNPVIIEPQVLGNPTIPNPGVSFEKTPQLP